MKDSRLILLFAGLTATLQTIFSYPALDPLHIAAAAVAGASWILLVWLYRFLKKWRIGPKDVKK